MVWVSHLCPLDYHISKDSCKIVKMMLWGKNYKNIKVLCYKILNNDLKFHLVEDEIPIEHILHCKSVCKSNQITGLTRFTQITS